MRLAELLALARIAQRFVEHALAMPQATAEMWSRPRSSTFIAVLKPWPGLPPMMFAAGTRTFVEDHVAGLRAALAHLLVGLAELRPGGSAGTMKAEMPPAPGVRRCAPSA